MIFLIILSIILIWLQTYSLRFTLKANNNQSVLENAKKMEEFIPESEREFSWKSVSAMFSLGVIGFLNLVEIGYFIYCVYFFDDFIINIGGAVLSGYTIYSFIKFLPNLKKIFKSPYEYLKQKIEGFDNVLNLTMTSLEIVFCSYVLVKLFLEIF